MSDAPAGAGGRGGLAPFAAVYLLPGGVAALAVLLKVIELALSFEWNSPRLAPSFALVRGHHLYYGQNEGPVLNTIYGPVTALAYLPTTLATTPTAALLLGSLVSAFLYFAPVAWLLISDGWRASRDIATGFLAVACFALVTDKTYPLSFSAFTVHADAPALGLAALACGFVYLRRDPRDRLLLALSACSAVLAVWSKQTMILLPAALLLYLWLTEGGDTGWRFMAAAGLSGAVSLALFWKVFDGPAMAFNLVSIPGKHPLRGEWVLAALRGLGNLVLPAAVTLVAFSLPGLVQPSPAPRQQWRRWLAENRWALFVLVAALNVPLCVLGRIKVGGGENAFSPTVYPLLIATFLLVAAAARPSPAAGSTTLLARGMLTSLLVGLAVLWLPQLREVPRILNLLRENNETMAYQTIRERPGTAYFPENPLAHILAENKVHHFSYALLDRSRAGFPVTRDHLLAHIPVSMDAVFLRGGISEEKAYAIQVAEILQGMPGFQNPPEHFRNWTIHRKSAGR